MPSELAHILAGMIRPEAPRFGTRPALAAGIVATALLGSHPAAAQAIPAIHEPTAAFAQAPDCGKQGGALRLASVHPLLPAAPTSKSSAILGGRPSALDLIRATQETGGESLPATHFASSIAASVESLEPAAGGMRFEPAGCTETLALAAGPLARARPDYSPDDFLASRRLAIGRTTFDASWQRVRHEQVSSKRLHGLVGTTPADDPFDTLGTINAWVNRAIVFTDDRELFGRADYWAGAKKTLKLGRGDCEDIALTKMQLLAAAGIPREDMVLTIARDLVRNADHAVLIVRLDGRYFMLDNSTDEILDASLGHDYRPVLSFGHDTTWLHGY